MCPKHAFVSSTSVVFRCISLGAKKKTKNDSNIRQLIATLGLDLCPINLEYTKFLGRSLVQDMHLVVVLAKVHCCETFLHVFPNGAI